MLTVKVVKIPGGVREIALEDGATVADALAIYEAEFDSVEGYTTKMNDTDVTPGTALYDGAKIYLAKQVKGNC